MEKTREFLDVFFKHRQNSGGALIRVFTADANYGGIYAGTDNIIDVLKKYDKIANIYIGLNPFKLPPTNNLTQGFHGEANTATVAQRAWCGIDIDPEREPKKRPATDEEYATAKAAANEVIDKLLEPQELPYMLCHSGNGAHILLPIHYDTKVGQPTEGFLNWMNEWVQERYKTLRVDITADAPRIWRVPGSWNTKAGRRSEYVLRTTRPFLPVDLETSFPESVTYGVPKWTKYNGSKDIKSLDIVQLFKEKELYIKSMQKSGRHIVTCPWNESHSSESRTSTIIIEPHGDYKYPAFICKHQSHGDKKLSDIVNRWGEQTIDKYCSQSVDQRKKTSPFEHAEMILQQFKHEHKTTLLWWNRQFWKWINGVYQIIPDDIMKAKIMRWIQRHAPGCARSHWANDIYINLRALCMTDIADSPPVWLNGKKNDDLIINLKDTMLHMEEGSINHTPDYFSIYQIPQSFNGSHKIDMFMEFLKEVQPDKSVRNFLQEWMGYCLVPVTKAETFILFEGEGANGKSVFLNILRALIGKDAVSSIPMTGFEDYQIVNIVGKLVNIATEMGSIDRVAEGNLRAMVSGEPITINPKYERPFELETRARLVFSTNSRPKILDRSNATWRRLVLVPWKIEIQEQQQDRDLSSKIISTELDGVFAWAIVGLMRLKNNAWKFNIPQACIDELKEYKNESNPHRVWLQDNYQEAPGQQVTVSKIYEAYRKDMKDSGYSPLALHNFGKEIRIIFKNVIKKRESVYPRYYFYEGLMNL